MLPSECSAVLQYIEICSPSEMYFCFTNKTRIKFNFCSRGRLIDSASFIERSLYRTPLCFLFVYSKGLWWAGWIWAAQYLFAPSLSPSYCCEVLYLLHTWCTVHCRILLFLTAKSAFMYDTWCRILYRYLLLDQGNFLPFLVWNDIKDD